MGHHLQQLKQRVCKAVDRNAAELIETADWIHAHPEIGHQEVEASRRLTRLLESAGIPVEAGTAGMGTAFKAELGGKRGPRPRIAILAEYDALPGLGHGCGHNLIGTSAVGAGLALSEVIPELNGSIWVLGTPAEESAFFVGHRGRRCGQPLNQRSVDRVLGQFRTQLGWLNRGAHHAPRVHDTRHTFVVRRILAWQRQGVDIDQAMLALSTYVGHARVSNTYWYLTAVPELMALAAKKFESKMAPRARPGERHA